MTISDPERGPRPTRRTLVRGAAWTIPVVTSVAAAPAFAASICTGVNCPSLAFGAVGTTSTTGITNGNGKLTAGNGWTMTSNGTGWSTSNANDVGFITSGGVTRFAVAAEPTTAGRVITAAQTGQPLLLATCTYTISFNVNYYTTTGSQSLTLRTKVGTTTVDTYVSPSGQNVNTTHSTASFTGNAGAVSFEFTFGGAGDANDLTIWNPTITCA